MPKDWKSSRHSGDSMEKSLEAFHARRKERARLAKLCQCSNPVPSMQVHRGPYGTVRRCRLCQKRIES
jgi:hypothetical protein